MLRQLLWVHMNKIFIRRFLDSETEAQCQGG